MTSCMPIRSSWNPKTNNSPAVPTTTSVNAKSTATTNLGWMSSLRDLPREHGFEPLRVEGTIPADLVGTLYRVGPSLFSSFGKPYGHLFDGDGAVTAVRFANGRALGAAKLVQSEGLVEERRAGHQIYGGYGTPVPGLKRFLPLRPNSKLKNPANTSILLWGERVFGLYEGDVPTEIAPSDLATLGEKDLGMVVESFSAHPRGVPSRRAMYNFGLRYGRKTVLDIYVLDNSGRGRKVVEIALERTTMIHDFIATEKHLVFFSPPIYYNPLRLLFGVDTLHSAMRWKPELGTEVIVVPIDDPQHWTCFTIDPFFQWHFLNGYERGNGNWSYRRSGHCHGNDQPCQYCRHCRDLWKRHASESGDSRRAGPYYECRKYYDHWRAANRSGRRRFGRDVS